MLRKAFQAMCCFLLLTIMGEEAVSTSLPQEAPSRTHAFESLHQGTKLHGFTTSAIYLNDDDKPFGARFKHDKTGFTLDMLQIQSVPQSFMWVNTLVNSDSGVAHTQEHLLLGKGNKGRNHGTRSQMALVSESAGTDQWRTYYHFNTSAGAEVYYKLVEQYLDLLLNPDYTDEEVRREVRNFAVKEDSKTKALALEEKGTVYNEMTSQVRDPNVVVWWAAMHTLYGRAHPLSYNQGGTPQGIRALKPAEIRRFHDANYVLNNMGMIGAIPKSMPLDEVLNRLDASLNLVQKKAVPPALRHGNPDLPAFPRPKPKSPPGSIQIVSFPEKNAQKPGLVEFLWPARLQLSTDERLLLKFFLNGFAGDADTPLYKVFIDSRTVKIESLATGVYAWLYEEQGFPIMMGLNDVAQTHINQKDIAAYRKYVMSELQRIAKWKDGSPELAAFNKALLGRLAQTRRYYSDFVNKPPSFGQRHNNGQLMKHLIMLERKGGNRRSVTMKPEFAYVERMLKSKTNIWRTMLAKWHLLDTVPDAIGSRPSADMISKEERESHARLQAETERLKKMYHTSDAQHALRLYREAYDAETARLESQADIDPATRKFIDSPPLTADDQLDYKLSNLSGNVPLCASTFDSMTSGNTLLALRLDGIAEDDLVFLPLLPDLIARAGIIEDGKPISYEKMTEMIRQEIYYLNARISTNFDTGRAELKLDAAGTTPEESVKAVAWIKRVLFYPYWQKENLPRLRDVIQQSLSEMRGRRDSGYEETWDTEVSRGMKRQDSPLLLSAACFLTGVHNAQRVSWMLKGDVDAEALKSFVEFMNLLAGAGKDSTRDELAKLLSSLDRKASTVAAPAKFNSLMEARKELPAAAKELLFDAVSDLSQDIPDVPDSSLAADWAALCQEMATDVRVPPVETLKRLDNLRRSLLKKSGARLAVIGSTATQQSLSGTMEELISELSDERFEPAKYTNDGVVYSRLNERAPQSSKPIFWGLVNPNTHQGVVINSAPALKYTDTDDESLKRILAFSLYGGGGAHSLFMKTWGAGLAYGNGSSWSPNSQMGYYADKMPAIPETLRFVAEQLKNAKLDPSLTEYAVAQCFHSRAGETFESRGEAMSNDITDGVTPDVVRSFRSAILKLRHSQGLADALFERMLPQYGRVIPGLGVKAVDVKGGIYLAIGDEKQLSLWQDYLKSTDGSGVKVQRIWARDFWIMPKRVYRNE